MLSNNEAFFDDNGRRHCPGRGEIIISKINQILTGWRIILTLALIALAAGVVLAATLPGEPPNIHAEVDGATVDFALEQPWIVLPGGCVTARWQVDRVQAVYVDGAGVAGEGAHTSCDGSPVTLRVVTIEGVSKNFTLPVPVLARTQPGAILLAALGGLLLLLAQRLPLPDTARWILTLFMLIALLVLFAWLILAPGRAVFDIQAGDSRAFVEVSRAVMLPGQCATVNWLLDNTTAAAFNDRSLDVVSGQTRYCPQTLFYAPPLTFEQPNGVTVSRALPLHPLAQPYAAVLILAGLLLTGFTLWLMPLDVWQALKTAAARLTPSSMRGQYLQAFLLAVLWIVILGAVIHVIAEPMWDGRYYYRAAQLEPSGFNIAPYAYRFITPVIVSGVAGVFRVSLTSSFLIVAYLGAILQMWLAYVFARDLGARHGYALFALGVVALSRWNVKYLMFDPYRPDLLAYALLFLMMILLLRDRRFWLVLVAGPSVLFREFLVAPVAVLCVMLLIEAWQERSWRKLIGLGLTGAWVVAFVALPRLLMPITRSDTNIDPFTDISSLSLIVRDTLNFQRHFNMLQMFAIYFIPVLLLATPHRLRRLWEALKPYRLIVLVYGGITLFGTIYGGHDLGRYTSYFVVLLVMLVVLLLENNAFHGDAVHWMALAYTVVVLFILNNTFAQYPSPINTPETYVDALQPWAAVIGRITWLRWLDLGVWLAGGVVLRQVVRRRSSSS